MADGFLSVLIHATNNFDKTERKTMNMKALSLILPLALTSMLPMTSCASVKPVNDTSTSLMKVITYNVLYGFNHHKNLKEGAEWLNKQNPDVLALQELNGFTQQKLEEMAVKWNHPYAVILKERGFPVGLTSKTPITVIEKKTAGFKHGYLHCQTAGIDFIVLHLNPHDYLLRQKEATTIVKKAKKLLAENKSVILLGDFNARSPFDKEMLEAQRAVLVKSGETDLAAKPIDYSVMEIFEAAGLVDICNALLPYTEAARFTLPTEVVDSARPVGSPKKAAKRIDYLLLDKNLVKRCTSVTVPRDAILNSISDHFPIIMTLHRLEEDAE